MSMFERHFIASAIVLGLVAVGAGAADLLNARAQSPGDAASPAATPAPAADQGGTQIKIVDFVEKTYPVVRDTEALGSPASGAPLVARLRQDVPIKVVGVVEGMEWLQVELPDKRIAFVPVDAVPAATSAPAGPATSRETAEASPAEPPASGNSTSPPSAQTAALPPQAAPDAAAVREEPESTEPLPEPVEFQDDSQSLYVLKRTGVFVEPSSAAPQAYLVDRGTAVESIAKTKDGKWAWVTTEDGRPAFIAMADLAPSAPLPDDVSGVAQVVDTATIKIGTQKIALFGIEGIGGVYSKQLQSLIDVKGKKLDCRRTDEKYVCDLPGGLDVGEAAILNGAARPGPDASPEYLQKAAAAKAAGRGIWAPK